MSRNQKILPDKIVENFPIMSQTGFEILDLVRKYNVLPVGNSQRKVIYEKIEELVNYERDWN